MELGGRWALVTGGARWVGRAICLELAAAGANVLVHYRRSRADAEATAADVRQRGCEARVLQADLADAGAVRALADTAESVGGGVTVLVNNASNYLRTPWSTLDEAVWNASVDVNLKAPYLLAVALGGAMRGRGEGAIVNLGDWAVERPYRHHLPYSVSKAGLVALTKGLACELAPAVRVNGVAPGPVLLPEGADAATADAIRRATPLGIGCPEDVARVVRFLVAEAAFTTGAIVHVDGGRALA